MGRGTSAAVAACAAARSAWRQLYANPRGRQLSQTQVAPRFGRGRASFARAEAGGPARSTLLACVACEQSGKGARRRGSFTNPSASRAPFDAPSRGFISLPWLTSTPKVPEVAQIFASDPPHNKAPGETPPAPDQTTAPLKESATPEPTLGAPIDVLDDAELEKVLDQVSGIGGDTYWYKFAVDGLVQMQQTLGMPWWMTVIVLTLGIRIVFLPITLYVMRYQAKAQAMNPVIQRMSTEAKDLMKLGRTNEARQAQKEMQVVMNKEGVNPLRALIGPISQMPVFISLFVTLRKLAEVEPSLVTGGALWFIDLSQRDPFYILPALSGLTMLGMMELSRRVAATQPSPGMIWGMRGFALISTGVMARFPAVLFMYWLTTNSITLLVNLLTQQRAVREMLGYNDVDPSKYLTKMSPAALQAEQIEQYHRMSREDALKTYTKKPRRVQTLPGTQSAGGEAAQGRAAVSSPRPHAPKSRTTLSARSDGRAAGAVQPRRFISSLQGIKVAPHVALGHGLGGVRVHQPVADHCF
ncbi:Mitochondrial inner membrane protein OXA1 [Porphyridium purpureum]|uniref:Mitochondrial inner membrane protein OXA1 n=1 Tax=Porphyridium purpureum TaxID=35688 RepID=A0A5J4YP91_PORPP|nr:Mitochondrial inner membrane protein OXA1 [Porphyridium purpureum]|eukprot:POR8713..scf296_7